MCTFMVCNYKFNTMKKILLISMFLVAILPVVQSQTWIGVSQTVGLKNVYPDMFNPDAGIYEVGLMFEHKFSKKMGFGFGIHNMRYNYYLSDIYYSYSRCPFFLNYHGRLLNIKPTLYIDVFRGTNNTEDYYLEYSDLDLYHLGFGVSFSKDISLSKRLLLEPEITYKSTSIEFFEPELTFGVNLKYQLK